MKGVFVEHQRCIQTHLRYSLDKIKKVTKDKTKMAQGTVLCEMYLTPLVKYYINRVCLNYDCVP